MAAYLLTAVTAEGYGLTYHWGDTYEVRAESYEAAEADVLGRAGGDGERPYELIVKAWAKDGALWAELPLGRPVSREELALTVACPECRAGTAEKCRRLKVIGAARVPGRQRIAHPHIARTALAEKKAQRVLWPHDVEGSYHDASRCACDGHCVNCFEDLDQIRETRAAMIDAGTLPASGQLGARERYCSPWCRNRAQRERALDRALGARKEES